MIDFAALPPEINSARMYSGPGSTPMLAAAAAWNAMAAEMRVAAASYGSVVSELASESWFGPSSVSMSAAAAPYVEWLSATAVQAEQVGTQANAAAAAYESAFSMTVPPATITVNRAQLAMLVATNVLGQNTPAIAATEAQYGEMWAQDAAAMYGYAGASQAASELTPLSTPQNTTTADGTANQANAVSQANSASARTPASALSDLADQLNELTVPGSNQDTTGLSGILNSLDGSNNALLGSFLSNASTANLSNAFTTSGLLNPTSFIDSVTAFNFLYSPATGSAAATSELTSGLGQIHTPVSAGVPGLSAPAVSAETGQANLVGRLSVPASWVPTNATTQLAAAELPGGTPMVMEDVGPVGMPGLPLSGMANGADDDFSTPSYGFRPRVLGRPPAAG